MLLMPGLADPGTRRRIVEWHDSRLMVRDDGTFSIEAGELMVVTIHCERLETAIETYVANHSVVTSIGILRGFLHRALLLGNDACSHSEVRRVNQDPRRPPRALGACPLRVEREPRKGAQ